MDRNILQVLTLAAGTILGVAAALDAHLGRVSDVTLVTAVALGVLAVQHRRRA